MNVKGFLNHNDSCSSPGVSCILLSWGRGGGDVRVDEKFLFREKNGCTPNYFFQKIGGTP